MGEFQTETGQAVEPNYGASSDLARQIGRVANADLFNCADEAWADHLAEKELIEERKDLLGNRLVVAVRADNPAALSSLGDLTGPGLHRLALAGPAVPAGRYAREALRSAAVWEKLQNRVLEAGDVRAALTYVVRGDAEAGIVYATDVRGSDKVRVAFDVPGRLHSPIRYPLVLIRRDSIKPAARRLFDFLRSEKSAAIFREAGFEVIP